jgi:hypothetical protein
MIEVHGDVDQKLVVRDSFCKLVHGLREMCSGLFMDREWGHDVNVLSVLEVDKSVVRHETWSVYAYDSTTLVFTSLSLQNLALLM